MGLRSRLRKQRDRQVNCTRSGEWLPLARVWTHATSSRPDVTPSSFVARPINDVRISQMVGVPAGDVDVRDLTKHRHLRIAHRLAWGPTQRGMRREGSPR